MREGLALTRAVQRPIVARDVGGGGYLERFLICAVVAILGIRGFLELTGYPQIGGGGLHIAHMLWGGLLMVAALVVVLAFLNRGAKRWGAVLGGLGFGAFIDELGKFITSDNDYFFRPTIGLIYVILIVLFLTFRWIGRGRALSPQERLVNVAALLPQVLLGGATRAELQRAMASLAQLPHLPGDVAANTRSALSGTRTADVAHGDGGARQGRLLQDVCDAVLSAAGEVGAPERGPSRLDRLTGWGRMHTVRLLNASWLQRLLLAGFVFSAVGDVLILLLVLGAIGAALFVPGATITFDPQPLEVGAAIAATVSAGFTVVGALRLRHSRRAALILFRRAQLISIFFTEVFLFFDHELAGLSGLAQDVVILLAVDFLLRQEPHAEATPADAEALPSAPRVTPAVPQA